MNGCLKVFTVYVLKPSGIDDTIEIRIIILVEIFPGSRSILEKKNDKNHLYQDSNDSTSTPAKCRLSTRIRESQFFHFEENKSGIQAFADQRHHQE